MTVDAFDGSLGLAYYRIGGHEYPRRVQNSCPVCRSDYRFEVERDIASGRHYRTIAEGLPESAGLTSKQIAAHFTLNHMPLRQAAVRRIVEDRAAELGQAIESGVDQIADHVALARVVVNRSFQAIAEGKLEPTVADGIAAAKILQQTGVNDEEVDKGAYVEAFVIYMETAQQVMSPEQFAAFGRSLQANPVLRALVARQEAGQGTVEDS